jgi:hypothetical protein
MPFLDRAVTVGQNRIRKERAKPVFEKHLDMPFESVLMAAGMLYLESLATVFEEEDVAGL